LGHARTFLIAYWHARSRGGRLLMRMEDLDGPRVLPDASTAILHDLEWLGIDWDGPVVVQSETIDRTSERIQELLARGEAYACTCTRGDIRSAASAPHVGMEEPRYPGTCRGRWSSVEEAERATGRPAGIRFVVPDGTVTILDGIAGETTWDVAGTVGDFLIARRGGLPAYQIAVVVDDSAQGVTEVVRGEDLLSSAARQVLLQRALGLPRPSYWHVPLVEDEDGRRLAKRSDDVSLATFRDQGVDPRRIVQWVAMTCGMPVTEGISAKEAVAGFSIDALPRNPVRIDANIEAGWLGKP
jgi:glutamyl-tRNA synthetase